VATDERTAITATVVKASLVEERDMGMWTNIKAALKAVCLAPESRSVQKYTREVLRQEGLWDEEYGDLRTHEEFPEVPQKRLSELVNPRPASMNPHNAHRARRQAMAQEDMRRGFYGER
jgi:hypothetical protein